MDEKPDFLEMTSKEEDAKVAESVPDPAVAVIAEQGKPTVTFMGNNYDLAAVAALITGGAVLLACGTCGLGYYCLPLLPLIFGIIGLVAAKDSIDPERTKRLSWIGVGVTAVIVLLGVLLFVGYFVFVFFMMGLGSMSSYGG